MTMQHIASYTVTDSGYSGPIYMLNIPQTFQHLHIRIFGRSKFNAVTSGFYAAVYNSSSSPSSFATHSMHGDGTTVVAASNTGLPYAFAPQAFPGATATANVFSSLIIDLLDYTSTSKNKTMKMIYGHDRNGSGFTGINSQLFVFNQAVDRFYIDTESSFAVGTRIDIYGINSNPIATGA